jgi:hypothetical protein
VSFTISNGGPRHFKIIVRSHTENVEQLVLDSLTGELADLRGTFNERASDPSSEQILRLLSRDLRDGFHRTDCDEQSENSPERAVSSVQQVPSNIRVR